MPFITVNLMLPASTLDDCVQLLADDPALLAVIRGRGGWLISDAPDDQLFAKVDSLLAERAINLLLRRDCERKTEIAAGTGSRFILKIRATNGRDKQLCDVCIKYKVTNNFCGQPANFANTRVIRENPVLVSCFKRCTKVRELDAKNNLPTLDCSNFCRRLAF